MQTDATTKTADTRILSRSLPSPRRTELAADDNHSFAVRKRISPDTDVDVSAQETAL